MIISASRRTDIPAYFSEWFLNRIEAQYAYVRNPMNIRQVSSISLSPELVDCIVFWSKNPRPLMDRLEQLHNYMYYFQFTLNAYGKEIEQNLPTLDERINTFQVLSEKIGRQRVIWRYDPVLLNDRYTISWHAEQFETKSPSVSSTCTGILQARPKRKTSTNCLLYKKKPSQKRLLRRLMPAG